MGTLDTARCSRCKRDYPFAQVRYLPDGKSIACHACLGVVAKEAGKEAKAREGKQRDFQCVACRYTFRRSDASPPRACPQCGERRMIGFEREKMTGDALLKL